MSFDKKRLLLFGFIVVLLLVVPLTVYILQKQQQTRSQATASTTLELTPASVATNVGKTFDLQVMMNPGTNQVIASTLIITYDPTKLATQASSLVPNDLVFPSILEGPVYTNGKASITVTVGVDVTKAIQQPTKIATVTFHAIAETGGTPTEVGFSKDTNITSTSDPEINVLSTTKPALITIGAAIPTTGPGVPTSTTGPGVPTPTTGVQPTNSPRAPTNTQAPSPITTPGLGGNPNNQPPICSGLTVDRTPSGTAPFSVTFTVNGSDSDGTIQKATFNFGDGPVQNVLSSGGIGTNSVSAQISHTYNNAGSFNASAILTDNNNAVSSSSAACSQTITVSEATPTQPGLNVPGPGTSGTPPTEVPTPRPTMQPGPGDVFLGIGAVAAILTIIGGFVFFTL